MGRAYLITSDLTQSDGVKASRKFVILTVDANDSSETHRATGGP